MTTHDALRTTGTSADVIRDVFDMHFPAAESVCDLTYGRGTFWRWAWRDRFTLHANDAHAELPNTDSELVAATRWDFTRVVDDPGCPEWQRFDVVVFDPPFTARRPLAEAVRIPEDYGASQPTLFGGGDDDSCDSGYCMT